MDYYGKSIIATLAAIAVLSLCLDAKGFQRAQDKSAFKVLGAPTYYLVVGVAGCGANEIEVRGASNLPAGALIQLKVADFVGDFAWKDYSGEVTAAVDERGHFKATINPLPKMTFHHNLVLTATFRPGNHKQPAGVLAVVGEHGEKLDVVNNPQAGQMSGFYQYLFTIARVASPCLPE